MNGVYVINNDIWNEMVFCLDLWNWYVDGSWKFKGNFKIIFLLFVCLFVCIDNGG